MLFGILHHTHGGSGQHFNHFGSNEPYQHRAQLHRDRNHRPVRLVFVCFTTQRSLQVADREEHR